MSSAPADERSWKEPPWQASGHALLVLFLGFVFVETAPVAGFFALVTEGLAAAAVPPLRMLGFDMVRNGVELRDSLSGHAVAVTSACDGSGLIVGFFGLLTWLGGRTHAFRSSAGAILAAMAAILMFNLARVVLLFLSLGSPRLMAVQHMYVAPLLSAVLIAMLGFRASGLRPSLIVRDPCLWLASGMAAALAWYFVAERAGCLVLVPAVNVVLRLLPFGIAQAVSCSPAGAQLTTSAVQTLEPLALTAGPFYPSDFVLATPLAAATLLARHQFAGLAPSILFLCAMFCAAMAIAAVTAGYDLAAATQATALWSAGVVQSYRPPPPYWLASLKAMQNALVHFNLFILPLAIVGTWSVPRRPPVPQPPKAAARTRRRRRRKA